jgi:O-methyltransferase
MGRLEGALLEVGVWRGGTGALIGKRAALCGMKESVYLCDIFTGVVKTSDKDPTYKGGEHADTSRELVEDLVARLGLDNVKILEGIFPDETGHLIEHEHFRFCHIDADAYDSAKDVLDWVWGRMAIGGVVVFDDYGFAGAEGITRLVEELKDRPDLLFIHNINGHAIFVRMK